MSQLDIVIFIPVVFWFCIIFILFYFLVFSNIVPLIFTSLRARSLYFCDLMLEYCSMAFILLLLITFFKGNYWFDYLNQKAKVYLKDIKNLNMAFNI